MSDLISRAELFNRLAYVKAGPEVNEFKAEVYSIIQEMDAVDADAGAGQPLVVRCNTYLPRKEFEKWAEWMREQCGQIVCIPYDSEVLDTEHNKLLDRETLLVNYSGWENIKRVFLTNTETLFGKYFYEDDGAGDKLP